MDPEIDLQYNILYSLVVLMTIMVIALVFLIRNKSRTKTKTYVVVAVVILGLLIFIQYDRIDYFENDYCRFVDEYNYMVNVEPHLNSTDMSYEDAPYFLLIPSPTRFPDDKCDLSGDGEFAEAPTKYGIALNLTGKGGLDFSCESDKRSVDTLSMERPDNGTYAFYLGSSENIDYMDIDLHLSAKHSDYVISVGGQFRIYPGWGYYELH